MLGLAPPSSRNIMSVDCSPYLLSASPPGSSLHFYSLSLAFSDYCGLTTRSTCASNTADSGNKKTLESHEESHEQHRVSKQGEYLCLVPKRGNLLLEASVPASSLLGIDPGSQCSTASCCRIQKRVSFADSVGKPLVEVRLMQEASSEPPKLNIMSEDQDVTCSFSPLRLNFSQPCANFLEFDRKLHTDMVTVENVYVDGYKVEGTIFVRSISSQKQVFVRFTFDSWDSHCDVEATFISGLGPHDRYGFQFEVPSSADRSKSIEFAACLMADGIQHWDSNEGINFVVLWEPEKQFAEETQFGCDLNLNNNCTEGWWLDNQADVYQ